MVITQVEHSRWWWAFRVTLIQWHFWIDCMTLVRLCCANVKSSKMCLVSFKRDKQTCRDTHTNTHAHNIRLIRASVMPTMQTTKRILHNASHFDINLNFKRRSSAEQRESGGCHYNVVDIIQYLCYLCDPETARKRVFVVASTKYYEKYYRVRGKKIIIFSKSQIYARTFKIPVPRIITGMLL